MHITQLEGVSLRMIDPSRLEISLSSPQFWRVTVAIACDDIALERWRSERVPRLAFFLDSRTDREALFRTVLNQETVRMLHS